ncbi:MAG TPA: SDR family NAD(P)-dependent oxidoreductase [Acidimicrobiia bacterium]|nr:SDR family NAD(P)-dependent oxidoreductase [Acidimicrobiia bacterium]
MGGLSLEGKVAVVTGGGRGIGRAEALRLADEGAAVVVNDVGASIVGDGIDAAPADETASEIRARGGRAVAHRDDVSSWSGGRGLIELAVAMFGRLDVLVNNAGNSRPRMIFNMTEDDWDVVTTVHLKGSFVPTRFAAEHWREQCKRTGEPCDAAVVFTTSGNGLHGTPGHVNYAAAKAGIAAMSTVVAIELAPYGVRANAIAPLAFTRMTEELHGGPMFADDRREDLAPENVAAVVAWLASSRAHGITGQVVSFAGRRLQAYAGWHPVAEVETGSVWSLDALDAARPTLFPPT